MLGCEGMLVEMMCLMRVCMMVCTRGHMRVCVSGCIGISIGRRKCLCRCMCLCLCLCMCMNVYERIVEVPSPCPGCTSISPVCRGVQEGFKASSGDPSIPAMSLNTYASATTSISGSFPLREETLSGPRWPSLLSLGKYIGSKGGGGGGHI